MFIMFSAMCFSLSSATFAKWIFFSWILFSSKSNCLRSFIYLSCNARICLWCSRSVTRSDIFVDFEFFYFIFSSISKRMFLLFYFIAENFSSCLSTVSFYIFSLLRVDFSKFFFCCFCFIKYDYHLSKACSANYYLIDKRSGDFEFNIFFIVYTFLLLKSWVFYEARRIFSS
jgi:hypothetical protein